MNLIDSPIWITIYSRCSMSVMRINLGLMITAGLHSTASRGPVSGGLLIALELTGMSWSVTRGGPMLYMPRLCISLVSEAGMFWWKPSVPISDGLPWSLLCSSLVRIRLFLLSLAGGGLVCESAYFDGKQSSYPVDLPSVPKFHYRCLQAMGGEAAPAGSGFLWWHWPIGYVTSFFEEDSWSSGPSRLAVVLLLF